MDILLTLKVGDDFAYFLLKGNFTMRTAPDHSDFFLLHRCVISDLLGLVIF